MLHIQKEPEPGSNPVGHFDKNKAAQHKLSEKAHKAHKLKGLVDEIRRLDDEKRTIATALKALYAVASADGFNKKALQQVVKNKDNPQFSFSEFANDVQELEAYLEWAEGAGGVR